MTENTPHIEPRLELVGITKRYPAVVANNAVNLRVHPGEIHAVVGENGAGKSTLMKIIYGVTKPDSGAVIWEGQETVIESPAAARALGIGMVFQHFSLFETLTVAENISLALESPPPAAELARRISDVSTEYGLPVEPHRLVYSMSMGERQRVEIVRCLLQDPKLLIMDEPTSVLTPQAVQTLFATLRRLAAEGCSIVYISHKLDEIQRLCDSATVLRGGEVTGTASPREESSDSLARMMIGGALPEVNADPARPGESRLSVSELSLASRDPFGTSLSAVGFDLRGGEVLGIAGISGNGQKELLAVLSGERASVDSGTVTLCGEDVLGLPPDRRRALGLAFVPEERQGRGAVPGLSLELNALLTTTGGPLARRGLIRFAALRAFARRIIGEFSVKCDGERAPAESLSGGNLQKFIVGRETLQSPEVLVAAQPTWGVDVGAAVNIRQALLDLRARGAAVLVISEELDELFMVSDRIAVLAGGRLSPALPREQTTIEQLGRWMSGDFSVDNTGEARHAQA